MSLLTVYSFPKINLCLDIFGQTELGYHEIQTVYLELQNAPLFDTLTFRKIPSEHILVSIQGPYADKISLQHNSIVSAAQCIQQWLKHKQKKQSQKEKFGAHIVVTKNIPVKSGLGGAASNAAATLQGLMELLNLAIPSRDLHMMAMAISMDTPFFLHGGCALGNHFGEHILPLSSLPKTWHFKIHHTNIPVPTPWAYEHMNGFEKGKQKAKTEKFIQLLQEKKWNQELIDCMHNDFETMVFEHLPELKQKKKKLERTGANKVLLAGSGGDLVSLKILVFLLLCFRIFGTI